METPNTIIKHVEWSEFYNIEKDDSRWLDISYKTNLSEEFIEEFKDKVDWFFIASTQDLSESFIRKHKDKIDFTQIALYQYPYNVSADFLEEFHKEIKWDDVFTLLGNKHRQDLYKQFKKYLPTSFRKSHKV